MIHIRRPAVIFIHSPARRLLSDHGGSGLLAGFTLTNHLNSLGKLDFLKVLGISPTVEHDFGYDDYGRLGSVTADQESAIYGYVPMCYGLLDVLLRPD